MPRKSIKKAQEHKQEQVYEQLGLNAQDLPLGTNENRMMSEYKQAQRDEIRAQEEATEASGVVVEFETDKRLANGTHFKLPARLAFQESKVNLGRLPIWYLNALGSMNGDELDDFVREYGKELSLNERLALNLLEDANRGDAWARDKFWDIQMRLLGKTNVIQQVNVSVQRPDSVVSELLDAISENIKPTPTP